MKIRPIIKYSLLSVTFLLLMTFIISCNTKKDDKNKSNDIDELIANVMAQVEPKTKVQIGEFDSMIQGDYEEIDEIQQQYTSNTIFDAPKDININVIINEDEERPLRSIPSLLENIQNSNDDLGVITIKDRDGDNPLALLGASENKLSVASRFEYGEVYQIEINDAPYLCFENKDPKIRLLTIEIEDDPNEEDEYDIKELQDGIINIDRNNIKNKKLDDEEAGLLSFDYVDKSNSISNLKKGDVFFASIEDKLDGNLDFYGLVQSVTKVGNNYHIQYSAPNISDVYKNFRMKGESPFDLSDSKVLLDEKLVLEEFRNSTLALALGKTMVNEFGFTPNDIMNVMKNVNLSVNMNFVGNKLNFRIGLKLGSFKIEDGLYFSFDFGYEKVTEYNVDFDIDVRTKWIIPCGVDYKIKMVEDTDTLFYFKVSFDARAMDEIPSDVDYTDKLIDEMDKCIKGETNTISALTDEDVTPNTSGTRTTWPILEVNSYYFAPLQIKFKVDFYISLGAQAMGLFKAESHSKKVDFSFTNMSGVGQSESEEVEGTSNWVFVFGGSAHAEVGVRVSLGVSFIGLYDFLHAEGYFEAYCNVTLSGLLAVDIQVKDWQVSGYVCADFNISIGIRAGINFKVLVFDYNLSYSASLSLFRIKFDNSIEHFSEEAQTIIHMDGVQTINIDDDTQILNLKYFDGLNLTMKEKKFKANARYEIVSGALLTEIEKKNGSGKIFTFVPQDNNLIEISEDGVIHVKDGTPNEFTTKFTIKVASLAGKAKDQEITVHFIAGDTKEVYAGDDLIGAYRPSAKFILPEPEKIRGKEFDHYSYNGINYNVGDEFTLPSDIIDSITLELHYNDLPMYRVYFYDGYNIMVAFDEVYKYEAATPPYEKLRDLHMDEGWVFVSWDQSFDNVTHEMHVNAIYIKVS